jgi:opacity protein-like surface antigen
MIAARFAAWALVLTPAFAFAAFEREVLNPSSVALGGATVAHNASVSANPAAWEPASWASLAYTRPFRVEGLAEQSLRAGTPVFSALSNDGQSRSASWFAGLSVGADLGRFGNDVHSEDMAGIAFRCRFRSLSVGGRGVYYRRTTQGFRSASAFSPDVGFQMNASPTVLLGASVRRFVASRVIPSRELRVGARIGFRERGVVSEEGAMFVDAYRRDGRTGFAVGGEWRSSASVAWRCGVHNLPWQWAGGVEVRRRGFAFQYTVETHPALNATHIVGLTWER